jgi:hypothetical protein
VIVRNKIKGDFTTIRNEVLNRTDMSLKAKGLYCFLMSKPDGWEISIRGLAVQLMEGRDAVSAALHELEKLGFYQEIKTRKADGTIKFENVLADLPCTENPCTDYPVTENPPQVNTNKVNTDLVKTEKETTDVVRPKPGNADINEIFDYWLTTTGLEIVSKVKANRFAASNMLKKHGKEKLMQLVNGVALSRDDPYAPRIADFVQLQFKLNELLVWGRSKTRSQERAQVLAL